MLEKINKLKAWQASLVITITGIVVYFTGLTSPFWGDDYAQIVNNVPAHSITNIRQFFEGSTFYVSGQGLSPLIGTYYRPLMTTVFSLIYTIFGPHPVYYHAFQLMLCIGSAVLLYLIFRYSFQPLLSLMSALIFLVHPLNSQVAFAIPSMQDALLFFFGILALWSLLRFNTVRSLVLVAVCLFLSMLSKESAIVFIAMALLYLFWFNRERLYQFMTIIIFPIILYLAVSINAVGINRHSSIAPIDNLNLTGRLFTAPSIVLFYLSKFIFPWKLATSYYWVHSTFSLRYVLLPLIIDIAVGALIIYLALLIRTKASKAYFYTYVFFAIWAAIGLVPYLQIIPLDMTACETWFYFSMVGVLGMIGVVLEVYRVRPIWLLLVGSLLIGLLGFRTGLRGLDWNNTESLAYMDISASPENYNAYNTLAVDLNSKGHYADAAIYAQHSINAYPSYENYYNLGLSLGHLHDYSRSKKAYTQGLKHGTYISIYQNLAALTLVYGNTTSNNKFFYNALKLFPENSELWMYLAIYEDKYYGSSYDAQVAISKAASYGQVPQTLDSYIMSSHPYTVNLPQLGTSIKVQ